MLKTSTYLTLGEQVPVPNYLLTSQTRPRVLSDMHLSQLFIFNYLTIYPVSCVCRLISLPYIYLSLAFLCLQPYPILSAWTLDISCNIPFHLCLVPFPAAVT